MRASKKMRLRPIVRTRGFTLIELLLATALVAFIMLMAYSGLEASIKMADSGDQFIERSSRVRTTHEFLRRQLTRMLPLMIRQDAGRNISFEGERNRVRWVGSMPGYLGRGGPYVQELEIASDVLNYRYAILNGYEDGDLDLDEPVALIEGVASGEFSFRTIDNSGKLSGWESKWEKEQTAPIPLMLKLNLAMKPEARMQIPELIVAIVVDMNVGRPTQQFAQGIPR
jgi:general secretion pathway protein J